MFYFKDHEDLEKVMQENAEESIVRQAWIESKKAKELNDFIHGSDETDLDGVKIHKSLKEKYDELYPRFTVKEIIENGKFLGYEEEEINYIFFKEYEEVEVLDEEGFPVFDELTGEVKTELKPVIPDEYYDFDEEGNKVLKEKYQDAKIVPAYELFEQEEIEKFISELEEKEIDMSEYVNFIKPYLLKLVNLEFEKAMESITITYPESEQKTWMVQRQEATAYKADNEAPTPMLDGIAKNRKVDKAVLANKVLEKSAFLDKVSGLAIGNRQYAEDAISKANDITTLDKIIAELEGYRDVFYKIVKNKEQ